MSARTSQEPAYFGVLSTFTVFALLLWWMIQ